MKTAIQELIERAEKAKLISISESVSYSFVIDELNHFLEKEKQQIIDSYNSGFDDSDNKGLMELSGEIYYKLIYDNE